MVFFPSSLGIRQGDLLSPALFSIMFNLLSRILNKSEQEWKLQRIKVSRASPPISHLIYADDLVAVYGGSN